MCTSIEKHWIYKHREIIKEVIYTKVCFNLIDTSLNCLHLPSSLSAVYLCCQSLCSSNSFSLSLSPNSLFFTVCFLCGFQFQLTSSTCLASPPPPSLWAPARGVRRFQLTEQKPRSPPPERERGRMNKHETLMVLSWCFSSCSCSWPLSTLLLSNNSDVIVWECPCITHAAQHASWWV